ncbi:MAG TPA: ribonuclease P protein component [Candidatus Desulfovibrio intestinipullorum]|uniref:Ribonuclease P protein component n=1 Tax=Candidatus Desulfovibrio intestinipullorum TaxID=2838536 RepID=A0A9D1PWW4_9BACT|nr:ribonuclease P protein component [Candidatus Desulfovibrio intestinipullorum]
MQGTFGLSLPKESLIRTSAEYALCYAQGRRMHTRHFLLFVAPPAEGDEGVRLGTAVSRKTGHAVVRNRIKRVLRECFRLHLRRLPVSARIVVVAKRQAGSAALRLDDVTLELTDALNRYFHLS